MSRQHLSIWFLFLYDWRVQCFAQRCLEKFSIKFGCWTIMRRTLLRIIKILLGLHTGQPGVINIFECRTPYRKFTPETLASKFNWVLRRTVRRYGPAGSSQDMGWHDPGGGGKGSFTAASESAWNNGLLSLLQFNHRTAL